MTDMEKFRQKQLQDPEFRDYYNEKQAAASLAKSLIGCRIQKNLSQKELSKLTGISQADISRLERCEGNPSLKTLQKLAKGLGMNLKIEFVSIGDSEFK